MILTKKCIRCKNPFKSNRMIKGDDVCRTCERMNDITFWYPRLKNLGFPVPKTEILYTNLPLEYLTGGRIPKGTDLFLTELVGKMMDVGLAENGKVFLRTGYLSNKHDWKNSCFITKELAKSENRKELLGHITNLVEMSSVATIDRMMPIDFWAVREFIETEPYFNYFPGEMPITKERRYFVRNGKIECHHNYWDRKAFKNDIDENLFKKMADLSPEDEKILNQMANYVAGLFSGYWSLDFLKSKKGDWYLTDMAIGERSYHQEKCPAIKKGRIKD